MVDAAECMICVFEMCLYLASLPMEWDTEACDGRRHRNDIVNWKHLLLWHIKAQAVDESAMQSTKGIDLFFTLKHTNVNEHIYRKGNTIPSVYIAESSLKSI